MEMGLMGIVAALPEEIRPLQRRLQVVKRISLPGGRAVRGTLGQQRIVTLATGDGAERASRGLQTLLSRFEVDAILAIGIAGGLSDDLEVGDIVVAQRVTNGTGEVPSPDKGLLDLGRQQLEVRVGCIHSHSEVAIDPVAKQRLWARGGSQPTQVVDLETASYARVASAKGVSWLAIRAVSDGSDEALPLDFNRYRRPDGSSDRLGIGWYAVRHPSIVPELMQLRERLRHCADRLANLVEEMVSQ